MTMQYDQNKNLVVQFHRVQKCEEDTFIQVLSQAQIWTKYDTYHKKILISMLIFSNTKSKNRCIWITNQQTAKLDPFWDWKVSHKKQSLHLKFSMNKCSHQLFLLKCISPTASCLCHGLNSLHYQQYMYLAYSQY